MKHMLLAIGGLLGCAAAAFAQGHWTTEMRLPKATQETSVVALNGQVWVAAGSLNQTRTNALWSYDPSTRIWTSHKPYPGAARDHASIAAVGNALYLIGGLTAWPSPSVATVQRYDPGADAWTALASLPVARGAMGVGVINGKIYAAGGLVSGSSVDDFTVYDPATDMWTALPAMPTARDHLAGAVLNGKFYAIGGRAGNTCAPMNIVEIFDPATNAWTSGPPMQHAHGGHAIGTINGHIQVFGGEGSAGNCGSIAESEDFDPLTNMWTPLPNMPAPRHGIGGATIGTTVYLPGGGVWKGDAATAVHEKYDTSGTSTAGPVPSPWTSQDIGSVGIAGEEQFDNGVFTVLAAGANIWNSADSFRFIYQPLTGDGSIVAHVDTLGFTSTSAKAGIMIRESLAAGARHATLDSQPDDTVEFTTRTSTGGTTTKLAGGSGAEPIWLKVERSGSTITAFTAADGGTWTPLGSTTLSLPATVFVGLVVSSHLPNKVTAATIDHVTVTSAAGNRPPTVAITSPADGASFSEPGTINIAASASDPDGTIARVDFYANAALIASDTSAPFTFSWTNVPAGRYTLTAVAADNSGAETTSTTVTVTVTAATPPPAPLPSPWLDRDIGSVGVAGSASFSSGTFRISGSGADIWGTADAFHFVYQALDGDGQIVAHVTAVPNVNAWTKAEVMIRNTLDAGSAFAAMLVPASASKGVQFQSRASAGASATSVAGAATTAPYWIKVVRSGNTVTGFQSPDGAAWTQVGTVTLSAASSVFVGMAVTSHDNTKAATAAFDSAAVTTASPGALPPPWQNGDVGSVGHSGSASYNAGTFSVAGSGADIWGTADAFQFVYQPLAGDGQIVARVASVQNVNGWTKAEVMIRNTLAANASFAAMLVSSARGVQFQSRTTAGGSATGVAGGAATAPYWIKVVRSGNTVSGFQSPDGVTWTAVSSATLPSASSVFVGLAVTSHDNTKVATATFDNVAVTSGAGNAPPSVAITSPANNASFTAPATIAVSANASDSNGAVARVDFYASGVSIGGDTTSPYSVNWTNVPAGRYTLTAVATDNLGAQSTSAAVSISVSTSGPGGSLPPPWQNGDIGAIGGAGSSTEGSGTFAVKGSGTIGGGADAFQFAYRTLDGDGQIVARVATAPQLSSSTRTGVMLRNSLDANSAYGLMAINASGVAWNARTRAGVSGGTLASSATGGPPRWLKVSRAGSVVSGYVSADGTTWTKITNSTLTLGTIAYVGFAVASGSSTSTATATFDNVSVTYASGAPASYVPAPWTDRDIGSVNKRGSATYDPDVFSVTASGSNIWGTADSFNFLSQPMQGDDSIVARVTGLQNTNAQAKAGAMFRENIDNGSRDVVIDYQPSGTIEVLQRDTTGGTTIVVGNSTATLPVWLKLSRSGSAVVASQSADGSAWTVIARVTSGIPNVMYVGVAVTSHNATVPTNATFDHVSVAGATSSPPPPPPPPGGTISFNRKTIVVGGSTATATAVAVPDFQSPTSLAFGPDGRVYVSVVTGQIFALTLDPTKVSDPNAPAVIAVQEIDNIAVRPSVVCDSNGMNCAQGPAPGHGRQVTGIGVDPTSTAANVILWVTHSGLANDKTDMTVYTYGGAISRLTLQPDPADASKLAVVDDRDVVVGLPRSREAHTLNGVDFGPDGWMYIGIGGNTNAGAPSTFFANLPEYYLTSAVLRLNIHNLSGITLPIDVTNVKTASDMTKWANRFELYATGYRNPYDIVWHSNGKLYLNGNASNLNQGNTPGAADGCSTPSIDVGTKPDTLNIVTKGAYGGHPDPARHQCVWGDGTAYTPPLTPEAGWTPPIGSYGSPSADGITEYRSNAFNGAMKGHLISAVYAGDQIVRDVTLTADGTGVVSMKSLGQFSNPLDVVADSNGVIYVAEFGSSALTVLIPAQLGSCPVPGSDPTVTDSDKDGYTDADERANGTDMCSAASVPPDFDGDKVSDLNDSDDDGDGIADAADQLFFDATNGAATTIPLALEWNPGDGDYRGVAHSGFTGTQISSHGPIDPASGHALVASDVHPGDAGGHMTVWTRSGTAEGSTNTQTNALQIGFDSSSPFRVWSRITQPFTGITPQLGHVGGIFFGPDEDNYVRVALVGTASGGKALTVALEVNGVFSEKTRIDLSSTTISNLDVFIVGTPGTHTVQLFYDLNTTGTMTAIGAAVSAPSTWFTNNTGSARNTSLAGIMLSDGGATQMAFVYDFFRIDRSVP